MKITHSLRDFVVDFVKLEHTDGTNFCSLAIKFVKFFLSNPKVMYILTTTRFFANEDKTIAQSWAKIKWNKTTTSVRDI